MKARVILFYILLALWTALIAIAYLPIFIVSGPLSRGVATPWGKVVVLMARALLGISYEFRGVEHMRQGPVIIVSKHQSALEIIILITHFPHAAFILKRSLLFIPFFGMYLWRMGMIAIDRKGHSATLRGMLPQALRVVRALRPIIIFPEGTRTPAGEKGRYHPGVAAIYQHLKIPVVPVAVNTGVFWPRGSFNRTPGIAVVEFLPPIPPGLNAREFMRTVETRIETASDALYQEALTQTAHKGTS